MKKFLILLLFIAACTQAPESAPDMLTSPGFCNVDADCTCGGVDTKTGDCFIGNKLYASRYVDFSQQCSDFCSGIAGNLQVVCVNNHCAQVSDPLPVACTEDARVCADGSIRVRQGPNCEFLPCPEDSCTSDADCVPATTCHPTTCVLKGQEDTTPTMCTEECRPGTLDCGGSCRCIEGECVGHNIYK